MKADGEGDNFNEIAEEELSSGSGHLGVDEDMFPNFRKHGQVPLKLPAGVHDENHGEVQPLQGEDEAAEDGCDGVQQRVEPLLSGPPVRDQTQVTSQAWLNILQTNYEIQKKINANILPSQLLLENISACLRGVWRGDGGAWSPGGQRGGGWR